MSSFLTALLLTAAKSFGTGAMNVAGGMVASMVLPIVLPKLEGAVRKFMKTPKEDVSDPDLC